MDFIVTGLSYLVLFAIAAVAWSLVGTLIAAAVFRILGFKANWKEDSDSRFPIIALIVLWPLVITIGLAGFLFFIATRAFYRWCMSFIANVSAGPQPDYGD